MAVFPEERAYLIAAADELEDYLLSGAANWRLPGPVSLPFLTPGGVLLSKKRLAGLSSSDSEVGQIRDALDQVDMVCSRWQMAWIKRIKQEFPQRMRLWENYLDELGHARNLAHPEFRWNVRWRVIITLLEREIEDPDPGICQRLSFLDEQLRAISEPAQFVWEKHLEKNFDPTSYWFLYLQISHL